MIRKLLSVFAAILCITACQRKSAYENAKTIPDSKWALNQTIGFRDTLTANDPENLHFEVNIRHTNTYPYQNIWLYIQTKCSDGTTRLDSIDWKLSEPNGRWLGTGWGSLYSISYRLPDLTIRKTGKQRWFSIEIQHGLRDDYVSGIENVGVRLY